MHTVFVEVNLTAGYPVTVNPAQIVSIEPMEGDPENVCIIRMPMSRMLSDQATSAVYLQPFSYVVQESRESLQGRINEAQREAQEQWASAWKDMISSAGANLEPPDDDSLI